MQGGDRLMTEPGRGQVPKRPGSAGAFPHRSVAGDSRTAGSHFAETGGSDTCTHLPHMGVSAPLLSCAPVSSWKSGNVAVSCGSV